MGGASTFERAIPGPAFAPASCYLKPHQRAQTRVPLTVELNTPDDFDSDDRGGNKVNYEAERGPPSGVRNKLTSVLPKILEPVARKAEDEQPWRSRDGRGSVGILRSSIARARGWLP